MAMTSTPRPRPHTTSQARAAAALACAFLGGAIAIACASNPSPQGDPGSGEAGDPADPNEPFMASGVNATVIVAKCPDAQRINVRTAQTEIQRLVGPCGAVPGGRAHFSATLQPGGNILLASPEGNPADGVVPTCVLKNRLRHRMLLRSACTLDVELDERTVVVTHDDGGAPDAP